MPRRSSHSIRCGQCFAHIPVAFRARVGTSRLATSNRAIGSPHGRRSGRRPADTRRHGPADDPGDGRRRGLGRCRFHTEAALLNKINGAKVLASASRSRRVNRCCRSSNSCSSGKAAAGCGGQADERAALPVAVGAGLRAGPLSGTTAGGLTAGANRRPPSGRGESPCRHNWLRPDRHRAAGHHALLDAQEPQFLGHRAPHVPVVRHDPPGVARHPDDAGARGSRATTCSASPSSCSSSRSATR